MHAQLLQLYLTLCNPINCSPPGSSVHGIFPGKNTGMGCHALLKVIEMVVIKNIKKFDGLTSRMFSPNRGNCNFCKVNPIFILYQRMSVMKERSSVLGKH